MLFERDRFMLAARWGALAACLLLASASVSASAAMPSAAVALLLLAVAQTVCPSPRHGGAARPGVPEAAQRVGGAVEAALAATGWVVPVACVALTGGVRSPFLPALLPPVLASRAAREDQSLQRANELLTELHRVAVLLPASLDLATVVRTAADEVQRLLKADSVVISFDEAGSEEGGRADAVPLRANGSIVGWLSIRRAMPLFPEERAAVEALAGPLALAVDNARWFGRVRAVAAQEERVRLARELHDRLGQDLAAVGFELDALAAVPAGALRAGLAEVADDVRALARALRHTLADLRTDVDASRDLACGLAGFLEAVEARSGLRTTLSVGGGGDRLPLAVERELLRIAQEAVVNAERHARAASVAVSVRRSGGGVVLEVADDGIGLASPVDAAVARGRYGVLGMRERAEAVGGRLEVRSRPGEGTVVWCSVPVNVLKAVA